jgi:HTH-type transcriptional regulator/antitoxin HigA
LEVLATLVDVYEEKHFPIGTADPLEASLFRMEQQELDRRNLEAFIGSRHRVSEVLNRKRGLLLDMIRRLHAGLGIPLEVLVGKAA